MWGMNRRQFRGIVVDMLHAVLSLEAPALLLSVQQSEDSAEVTIDWKTFDQ
jgi:hypothetical protein